VAGHIGDGQQRPTTACLDENTFAAYFDQRLSAAESARLFAHVDTCAHCARLFGDYARLFSEGGGDAGDAGDARTLLASATDPYVQATLSRGDSGSGSSGSDSDSGPGARAVAPELGLFEFDGYRLVKPIGEGAMGQVYLGHDTLLDRAVAIKFVAAGSPDAATRERFRIEARAIARLQHPNVVAIYRVGELDGRPYLISEYVRGRNLAQLALPLAPARVVRIGLGLSRGLAAAHRRGVLHRDLKPANAILDDDDEVKLLDFGLAKLEPPSAVADTLPARPPVIAAERPAATLDGGAQSPQLTSPGSLVGTPLYMAPEIWLGQVATARSDIYSIGVILFELSAGRMPHREPSVAKLGVQVMSRDAPPLRDVAPTIDPALAAIVDRCLKREPEARFATADELRDAFEQLAGAHAVPLPEGNPYRGLRAFEAEHRGLFFGRGRAVRDLVERLRAESFVLVAGDSGVGKSSLCRAGILPLISDGGFADARRWTALVLLPGRRPATALRAALAPHLGDEAPDGDALALARALRKRQRDQDGLCLFVDQLEELVTLSEPDEAHAFATLIGALLEAQSVRLLATVRGDFLTRLTGLPELAPRLARALYLLQPLPPDGIREAIVGPARHKGVRFESEALVETLVNATAGAEGGLPLLQFALAELWEVRDQAAQVITAASLEKLGGVDGALARHADGVMAALRPAQRRQAQRILAQLVTVAGERRPNSAKRGAEDVPGRGEATRARRSESELGLATPDEHAALEALISGRLVVARESAEGNVFELAHEALIKGWPALRGWLDGAAESRAVKQRLEAAVSEWERLGRPRDAVWTERQLAELAAVDASELRAPEQTFVTASWRALRRVRRRRQAIVLGALVTLTLGWGGVRWRARHDLAARVAVHLERGAAVFDEARRRNRAVEAARALAFAAFDRGEREPAEAAWDGARAQAAEAQTLYANAGEALETALLLDGTRADVKARLVEVLYERALLGERDYQLSERDELLRRMRLYDAGGRMQQRWDAPATLTLTTRPMPARARIDRYISDASRRRIPQRVAEGVTPLGPLTLPPGSYLLTFTQSDGSEVHYPVLLARAESLAVPVTLPPPATVPPDFIYVAPGRFLYGSSADESLRRNFFGTSPIHEMQTGAYLIARYETTFAQWIDYLEHLAANERARRTPKAAMGLEGAISLERLPDGRWHVSLEPTTRRYEARSGELIHYEKRDRRAAQDWLKFPVTGISRDDAEAYARWLDATGRLHGARLCRETEWERAARGADDRMFPHGDFLAPDDANFDETYNKELVAFGPDEVGAHPASRSPFGADDMVGNAWEWVEGAMRGGGLNHGSITNTVVNREIVQQRNSSIGFRLCVSVK
jgi:serine/threonine protein kinase/formylglycine-generating enzyme required for sulfatase activity